MVKIFHLSYIKIFTIYFLFVLPCFGDGFESINLSKLDVFIHEGFSSEWIHKVPVFDSEWTHIPGSLDGKRSLSIRNLDLPNKPEHKFLSLKAGPAESFTFIFPIILDSAQANVNEGIGIGLVGIAYNWQIFFNGVLVEEHNYGIKNGKLIKPKRGKGLYIPIPNQNLIDGENNLVIHIIGSRDFLGTGMYYSNPYLITSLKNLNNRSLRLYQYGLVWFYVNIGTFWLYMFLRIPNKTNYLYFTGWAFAIAGYNLSRVDYLTIIQEWGLFSFRMEYFSIFISSFFFIGFIQRLLFNQIKNPYKIILIFYLIISICTLIAPISFINDLLRVWQFTIIIPMSFLTYQISREFKQKMASSKLQLTHIKLYTGTVVGSLFFGMIILFIFLGIDIFSSIMLFSFQHFNVFGFLLFTGIVTIVAFNEFIEYHMETKEMKEKLEIQIINRTKAIRSLSSALIQAQEDERTKLSRELHDEIGQSLAAVNINLQHIVQNQKSHDSELENNIRTCQAVMSEAIETIHQFSFNLRPSILDDLGLIPAMEAHGRSFSTMTKIPININAESIQIENSEIRTSLYRIFQEGLTNAAKHSDANEINVSLLFDTDSIQLKIQDDGKGFETGKIIPTPISGLGILGMKERVNNVKGTFEIISNFGQGVTILVSIPI
ncbi:MAG: sensor histidine kinase [Candidatus Marinimicrobia bacterium]|jgi:signal transduction histidine kinase|nr:sensor histidine kinase [Candidatus Neomarinimicrobiota bacterium]MBT5460499.1 sensor histidine kinase [Candidatus Neomarinimicrobiota bacterium]MBT7823543.1 sensor histidine kinase [Candidatus Neomarinimicrobiota bacterium]